MPFLRAIMLNRCDLSIINLIRLRGLVLHFIVQRGADIRWLIFDQYWIFIHLFLLLHAN